MEAAARSSLSLSFSLFSVKQQRVNYKHEEGQTTDSSITNKDLASARTKLVYISHFRNHPTAIRNSKKRKRNLLRRCKLLRTTHKINVPWKQTARRFSLERERVSGQTSTGGECRRGWSPVSQAARERR